MQKQTESAELRFRIDERAWVVIDEIKILKTPFPANGKLPISWQYGFYSKNVGKTIARNVRIHIDTPFGSNLTDHGIYLFQMRQFQGMQGETMGPDNSGPQSLAPGERSAIPFVQHDQAPQYGIYTDMVGRIDYIDAFDVQHWKTFCYFPVDNTGTLNFCTSGNDDDRNAEVVTHPAPKGR
jgi:hypothetical protein